MQTVVRTSPDVAFLDCWSSSGCFRRRNSRALKLESEMRLWSSPLTCSGCQVENARTGMADSASEFGVRQPSVVFHRFNSTD